MQPNNFNLFSCIFYFLNKHAYFPEPPCREAQPPWSLFPSPDPHLFPEFRYYRMQYWISIHALQRFDCRVRKLQTTPTRLIVSHRLRWKCLDINDDLWCMFAEFKHGHCYVTELWKEGATRRESRDARARNRSQLRQPPRPRAQPHLHPRRAARQLHHVCQVSVS